MDIVGPIVGANVAAVLGLGTYIAFKRRGEESLFGSNAEDPNKKVRHRTSNVVDENGRRGQHIFTPSTGP